MRELEEIAKAYTNEPPVKVDINKFIESIKDYLCDIDNVKELYAATRKIEESEPYGNSFLDSIFKNQEEKLKIIDNISNEIIECLEYINTVDDINALDVEKLEDKPFNCLAAYISYTDIIGLYVGEEDLDDETILKITLRSSIPSLVVIFHLLIDSIYKVLDEYIGQERASFVGGVAAYGDQINKRKLPKWVYRDYGYLINEIKRLIERPYKIINITINAINDGEVIEENEHGVLIKTKVKEKPTKYETIPLFRLDYSDKVAIADNEIMNILTTKDFNVDLTTIEKSEDVINKLEHLDRSILDFIVLELYGKGGITTFSDRDIAVHLLKEKSRETVTPDMLKEINDSIDRLRKTDISEGFISEKLLDTKHLKIKRKSALLNVDIYEIDYKNTTTHYKFSSAPFYYDYAVHTGRVSNYDREILFRKYKGLEHNVKNNTLIDYLTRRVDALHISERIDIDVRQVYDILKITDNRMYPKAREKAINILKELQDKDYNFKFRLDDTNTRQKTKKIRLYRDGDKPIKKYES